MDLYHRGDCRVNTMSREILVLSDLHAGGLVSISTPDYLAHREHENKSYSIGQNRIQRKLFNEWENMLDVVGNLSYTFLLGDLVDGCNPKSHNNYITMDIGDQVNMATELLSMIKCSKFIGVQGTEYHVGHDGISCDRTVVAELCRQNKKKLTFDHEVFYDIDGISFHAKHPGKFTSVRKNRPNVCLGEIREAMDNPYMVNNFFQNEGTKIMLRGHVHYNELLMWENTYNIYTPGWKGRDPYGIVKSNTFPECGFTWMKVSNGRVEDIYQHTFYAEDKI